MSSPETNAPNNALKNLRIALKVGAKNWLLLLLLPAIAYGFARLVTHRQLDQFGARTEILLEQKDEYDKAREMMQGVVGNRFQRQNPDIPNQIRVLRSRDLISKAVTELDHHVTHYIVGRVRAMPVGGLSGIEISANANNFSRAALTVGFDVNVLDSEKYELTGTLLDGKDIKIEGSFGQRVRTADLDIVINKARAGRGTINQAIAQGQRFSVRSENQLVNHYRSNLTVRGVGQTSILSLEVNDILADRAIEFLDVLSKRYLEYSTSAREEINRKTDEFLDTQLVKIESNVDSLQSILDEQRAEGEVLELTRNEQVYFQELVQLETQNEELNLNIRSLKTLENYLAKGIENTGIPPSSFLTQDPVASERVGQLYNLQLQRTQMLLDVTPSNFQIKRLDSLISTTRLSLIEYITEAKTSIEQERVDLSARIKSVEKQLFALPKSERELLAIERRLAINDRFYGYILEQKATNLIARAAITSNASIIEESRGKGITGPDKPKTIRNYTLFGLALAVGIAMLRLLLFERIESVNELRETTSLSVSGGIPKYEELKEKEYVLVASKSPRHPTTEAFRGLRTNLQYLLNKEGQNTILVSSMHPGEGKTFTATNLAALLAQADRRTLIIDFDLHKPRVHKAINRQKGIGLSGYLIGKSTWQDAIQKTDIVGLDVITSGPIPPNASELTLNPRVGSMIAEARKVYDFVVIDTPPILLITDALVLMKHVDRALLVANVRRANARGVKQLEDLLKNNGIGHVSMVLNGILPTRWRYYASKYAYRYLYSYGYGYGGYGSYTGYGGYGYGDRRYGDEPDE